MKATYSSAKTNLSTRVAFRVPHHNDSVTLLGYKGAESLPDVRGRGLVVWRGKFIEFQSFEVTYPMPSPEVLKSITERHAAVKRDTPVQDNDQSDDDKTALVLELYEQGKSNTAIVYEIWGTSGSSFAQRKKEVKTILATAATASESPNLPLKDAVSQQ